MNHEDNQVNSARSNNSGALPISIRNLTKRYGEIYALDAVDLNIESGEFLTLLGPSGSGKTTLLMAIAGFNRPDSGSIRFGDEEMILTPPHKREVGMVFQSYALFPHMSVAENIAFPLKLRGVTKQERMQRVNEALETVQLTDLGHREIDQLSGGQRQRVALARAFVFRPQILLMDEPLSALDKKLRERMQIELKQLHRQLGVTTVYVTHDQREALTMSDRIAVINEGRLVQVDQPEEIYNKPRTAFVADFIGESTMLSLRKQRDGSLTYNNTLIANISPDNRVNNWLLAMRPERLSLQTRMNASANADDIVFPCIVKEIVFQGESAYMLLDLGDGTEIGVRSGGFNDTDVRYESGSEVAVSLKKSDVLLVPDTDKNNVTHVR